jgi:hypothetical protein
MIDPRWIPLGYQQITSLAASTALTVPSGATCALIRCETQNVRWRDDGVAPTAAVGNLILTTDTQPFWYPGTLVNLLFIQVTASATLDVSYYR